MEKRQNVSSGPAPGIPGYETVEARDGARATVLRARQLESGADVVIRLLDRSAEPVLPKRFDRQRKALLQLSRDEAGIAPLVDHGVAPDGRDFVVSPFYPLGSLQDRIDRGGRTPWREAADLGARIAEIIGRAHEQNVVLGDLRPSKILMASPDEPVIAAFGMATRRFDDGRPTFLAPEADPDQPLTPAADVYALASIIGALIAGRAKERTETDEAFLAELTELTSPAMHDVLDHGLTESPTNRYRGGTGMLRALRRALDDQPAPAGPPPPPGGLADPEDRPADPTPGDPTPGDSDGPEEGLPPGLEDIVFLPRDATETISLQTPVDGVDDDEDEPDDLIPPPFEHPRSGDEDPTLIPFDSGADDDETDPFGHVAEDDAPLDPTVPPRADAPPTAGPDTAAGGRLVDEPVIDLDMLDEDLMIGADDDIDISQFVETREFTLDALENGHDLGPIDDDGGSDDDRSGDDRSDDGRGDDGSSTDGPRTGTDSETGPGAAVSTATLVREAESPALEETGPGEADIDDPERTVVVGHQREDTSADPPLFDLDQLDHYQSTEGRDTEDERDSGAEEPRLPPLDERDGSAPPLPPRLPTRVGPPTPPPDETQIFEPFETDHRAPSPIGAAASAAPPFVDVGGPAEAGEIPFRNVGRVRSSGEPDGLLPRFRVAAEMFWFRSRRTVSTLAAVLGLVAIVAVVVFFAARELRTATSSVKTDGVAPEETTTTGAPSVVTESPFVTDVPLTDRTTTTAPPPTRRRTTAAPAPAPTAAPVPDPGPDPTTVEPPTTVVEVTPPPVTEPPITVEPPPPTEEPPPVVPPPDPGDDDDAALALGLAPAILAPKVVSLGRTRAAVSYSSDQCVATRFELSGSNGSLQTGSSGGYDASVHCSTAWNLDFAGSSGLSPGVSYGLTLWVKGVSGLTDRTGLSFTTLD